MLVLQRKTAVPSHIKTLKKQPHMQKGLSIMKRIATFSVLLALLFSLFSCSAEKSFYDKAHEQLMNAKDDSYTVINGGGFNDGSVTVSSRENAIAAFKKVPEDFLEKRAAAYAEKHPVSSSIEYQLEGQTQTLEFEKVRCNEPALKAYCFENEYVSVSYAPETMDMMSFMLYIYTDSPVDEVIRRNKENNSKIVSTHDEAIEYAKAQLTGTYGIDLDGYIMIGAYLVSPDTYSIKYDQIYNGIFISIIAVDVNMYYGITWLQAKSYKADTIELYKSCVDYATTEKAREQAIQTLIADAKKDEQIAEIKNVQPFDSGFAEYIDEKGNQSYHHPTYGRITYIKEIDRLAVALYYSYTAVMKDGSEKQGANAIDVIIPIDWAEVYGEKDTISHTNE